MMKRAIFFLHGLDSSSRGNKGRWFLHHFPQMIVKDYSGSLDERLESLDKQCQSYDQLVLIGSSFGGLMAVNFALQHPQKCEKLVLLAPALNFNRFIVPDEKLSLSTHLIIGEHDTVTPPAAVLPLAKQCFSNLRITLCDDDHMLAKTFQTLDWYGMIEP